MSIRALIVDDEPLVRVGLRRLLTQQADIEILGECGDGPGAVQAIAKMRPNLLFLDVQMPGLSGFEVLEALREEEVPFVVFVTAHEDFAIRAFEVDAVDYLLKPFAVDRFAETLQRVRQRMQLRGTARPPSAEAMARLREVNSSSGAPLQRFLVRTAGQVQFLKTDDIDWFESADNYVRLHTRDASHLIRRTMNQLETELDPGRFLRIHRQVIVPIAGIAQVTTAPNGEYSIQLECGQSLKVGRTYRQRFRKAMDRQG